MYLRALIFILLPALLYAGEDFKSKADELYMKGIWSKAAISYEESIETAPSDEGYRRLARSYFYDENLDRSLGVWKIIESLYGSSSESAVSIALIDSLKSGSFDPLDSVDTKFHSDAVYLRALGIYRLYAGEINEALYNFYAAAEKDPNDYMSFFYIGKIYEDLEDFDQGIAEYKKAVSRNPEFAQALNNIGYCLKEKRFYGYAVQYYQMAINKNPENAGYYYNIGNAYNHRKEFKEAFDSYKKAVELDPKFAKAHYNMGRMYERMGKYEDVIKEFDLYIKYWTPNLSVKDVPLPKTVEEEIIDIEEALKEAADENKK